jgi:V8-like Glu-specific endopeptidase
MRSSEYVTPAFSPEGTVVIEPYSIIGSDDRIQVSPNSFPYSAVMYLALGQDTTGNGVANSWGHGTGFIEGPDLLVTAAHCIWSGTNGWVEEMRVHYKQNGSSKNSNYYYPLNWNIPTEYTSSLNYNYDWAVVTMQTNLGDSSGCNCFR